MLLISSRYPLLDGVAPMSGGRAVMWSWGLLVEWRFTGKGTFDGNGVCCSRSTYPPSMTLCLCGAKGPTMLYPCSVRTLLGVPVTVPLCCKLSCAAVSCLFLSLFLTTAWYTGLFVVSLVWYRWAVQVLSGMLLVDVTIFLAAPCTCGMDLFLLISEQEKVNMDLKLYYIHSDSIASFPGLQASYEK